MKNKNEVIIKSYEINFLKVFKTAIRKIFAGGSTSERSGITILYGGKSGNAAFVAKETGKHFQKHGMTAAVINMSKYDIRKLTGEKRLLVVVSTHGEGDPPPAAAGFYNKLLAADFDLAHLQFSVCALGDSSYEFFCQTGKDIDKRLGKLGACRFFERMDCDAEFEQTAAEWIKGVLRQQLTAKTESPIHIQASLETEWHEAEVKEKYRINEGSADEIFHVVLQINPGLVSYLPGDSIGIKPQNPPELVHAVLERLNCPSDKILVIEGKPQRLEDLLLSEYEITTLSLDVIQRYRQISKNDLPDGLLKDDPEMRAYSTRHDLLDLLCDFPCSVKPEVFISVLRRMKPRYYSIASSQLTCPDELHLTVKQVKYNLKGRSRSGACSTYLGQWLETGTCLKFNLVPSAQFRLPGKEVPLILIAAGTGIAPFRAFLQERAITGNGKNWLIFGEKRRKHDFLYHMELNDWLERRILTKLDVAFSRDGEQKIYVQHRILENGEKFLEWLEKGATVYVCGSLRMGEGVRIIVKSLYLNKMNASADESESFLKELIDEGRYCEDLY